jgi:hypothetical protein
MTQSREGVGPAILFGITWYSVHKFTPFKDSDFGVALLLWAIWWVAIRLVRQAIARLGERAWVLLFQLAVWYGLFLWLIPAEPVLKFLILWGIGTPLAFAGAGARLAGLRFPALHDTFNGLPAGTACMFLIPLPLFAWNTGFGFWRGLFVEIATATLAAIPLYYGWALAEPMHGGAHDARFANDNDYFNGGRP